MPSETDRLSAATCTSCGKPLTVQEFQRSAGAGHYCDSHRPTPEIPSQDEAQPQQGRRELAEKALNVAFKVTWVYGRRGPFTTPCTARGREINVGLQPKTWCSQDECPCRQLYDEESDEDYPADEGWPCFDAAIFQRWAFMTGAYVRGAKRGAEIPGFNRTRVGNMAFFTTRRHDMSEAERIIIGAFRIGRFGRDPDFDLMAVAAGDLELKVKSFSSHEARRMLDALRRVAVQVR